MLINRVKVTEKAPNSGAEVVKNVGLVEANEIGIISIKRSKWLRLLWKKNMQTTTNFFVILMSVYHVIQTIILYNLFLEKNTEFPVERYKEKIGKSYSKIDLHFRNVCNVDRDVNLKVNKVTIHGNSNQTISNQLKHQQSTNTSPTESKKIPSFLVSQGQQEVRQNPSNGEDGFESFVSLN